LIIATAISGVWNHWLTQAVEFAFFSLGCEIDLFSDDELLVDHFMICGKSVDINSLA
jgi:hypothetical protein